MAVPDHSLTSKAREKSEIMKKNHEKVKNSNKKVLLVAHEIKLTRILAGNSKVSRDRALKSLKKWFQHRSKTMPFVEEDFLRIWKGLFYSMWMSDKPLVQEECAEGISNLIHFPTVSDSMQFFKAGLVTLSNEWFGIDQLRLDKFLMFVRRLLRQGLVVLKNNNWKKIDVENFVQVLSETILSTEKDPPLGLFMHFTEIYLEEIAKISEGMLHAERFTDFIRPYIKKLTSLTDGRQIGHIRKFIFTHLIVQSDLGIEYSEKYEAWKAQGFPGSINSMQKIKRPHVQDECLGNDDNAEQDEEIDEEIDNRKALDPRAGRINVELPQIKFNAKAISQALLEVKFDKSSNPKTRKMISTLADQFIKLSNGIYPLGVKKLKIESDNYDTSIRKAVNRLVKFDKKIMGNNKKQKKKRNLEPMNEQSEDLLTTELQETTTKKKKKKSEQKAENLLQFIEQSEGNLDVPLPKRKKRKNLFENDETTTIEKKRHKVEENETDNIESKKKRKKKTCANDAEILSDVNSIITRPYVNLDRIECVFERNSGTWVVFNEDSPKQKEVENNLSFNDSVFGNLFETDAELSKTPPKKVGRPKNDHGSNSPKSAFIIHSEKKIRNELRGKNRLSLDPSLIRNPFSASSPVKKVKINTKLNKSQEFDEHHAQILSSPGIPFDANKKPSKPLLKVRASISPINPFYKLK